MQILVLGGTQFIGRHLVEVLLATGHDVTVFNRGRSADELPDGVERLVGDRDDGPAGLAALHNRGWDACIDVSGYTAVHVRASAELLRDVVDRYVFISAVSVYGVPDRGPVDESFPRVAPAAEDITVIDKDTYGPLKARCENIVEAAFGERATVLRPQIVAGPYDPFDRFSYWVRRATQPGPMMVPGDGTDFVQVIDVVDLARFARRVIETDVGGAFNMAGHRTSWAEFVDCLGARDAVWVDHDAIRAAGLTEFEVPLYRRDGGHRSSLMHVSHQRASAAGLTLTDLATTVASVRGWIDGRDMIPALAPDVEARLLAASRGVA